MSLKARIQAAEQEVDTLAQLRASLQQNNAHWREELTSAQKRLMSAESHSRSKMDPMMCI